MVKTRSMMGPVLAALLLSAAQATAQTQVIDEGGFRLMVRGQEVGTETFSIRQTGSGDAIVVIAVGKIVLDTMRGGTTLNSELQTSGSALRPTAYQVQVEGADAERIAGRVVGGRFSARIISAAGEQMREYLASDGAVVADEGIAHHYYFLAQRVGTAGGRVPIVVPRASQQVMATVAHRGLEAVAVGGSGMQARHIAVTVNGQERHVWVDGNGRVLRVEIPARGFVAERIAAPK